jgi:hypothetical protein
LIEEIMTRISVFLVFIFIFICRTFCLDVTSESLDEEPGEVLKGFPKLSEPARWAGGYKKCRADLPEIIKATKV